MVFLKNFLVLGEIHVNPNIFEEAAQYARIRLPHEKNLLIVPIEKLHEAGKEVPNLPRYPLLYVTKLGYIPYATKAEIIRRTDPNLFLLGEEEAISGWVAYALSTLTQGRVFRIFPMK